MRIRQEIAAKHWLDAAIEDIASRYLAQGYAVAKEAPIGNARADLIARKGDELIVMEFKLGNWSDERTNEVGRLRNEVVHRLGGKFNLVVVTPPKEKHIEIKGIEDILCQIFLTDIDELHKLASRTHVEAVSDVTITAVDVGPNRMRVEGAGVVLVTLHWDSDAENAPDDATPETSDSLPFDFAIILDNNLHIIDVERIAVDTSSYL